MIKIVALVCGLFCVQAVLAQADTSTVYLDVNEEPTIKSTSTWVLKIYPKDGDDSLFVVNKYDRFSNALLETGTATDAAGENKQGQFDYFNLDGRKYKSGNYTANKRNGPWQFWDSTGHIIAEYHYTAGVMQGENKEWHANGRIADSLMLDNNGNGIALGYFENGDLRHQGNYKAGKKDGNWIFYYPGGGGQASMQAVFVADSAVSVTCFAPDGKPMLNDCVLEREAEFVGGNPAWQKYLVKKIGNVPFYKYMKGINQHTVVLRFIVNTDGSVKDIMVENPAVPRLEALALKVMKDSPAWDPAVQYNRKVKAFRRQPITFVAE